MSCNNGGSGAVGAVGAAPRGGGGRAGLGVLPGRCCRPAAARPWRERAGGACARGQCRKREVGSPTSGPGATVTRGGGLNWV
jgi:hypothetical protein